MRAPTRLVACSACGCYARAAEATCPHCDASLRQQDGSFAPSKVALFLGLAALAAPLSMQTACSNSSSGGGSGGAGGSGTTDTVSSTASTSVATTTVTSSTISAYATGPTTSTTTTTSTGIPGRCDDSGDCGDSTMGCIACALEGNCAGQYGDCAADQDCIDFSTCAGACADQACYDQCVTDHLTGADIYNTLLVCVYCDECYNDCDGAGQGCP